MTRIINGVAYATDYEEIVGVEAGSGQHPVVRKVVTPGDVNFSTADADRPQGRRAAEPAAVTGQTKTQPAADAVPGVQPRAADSGH